MLAYLFIVAVSYYYPRCTCSEAAAKASTSCRKCGLLQESHHALLLQYSEKFFALGTPTKSSATRFKRRLLALHTQAFVGYSPIEEGGDNEINLHYTLFCDLSELLGATGVGGTGPSTKVRILDRKRLCHACIKLRLRRTYGITQRTTIPDCSTPYSLSHHPPTRLIFSTRGGDGKLEYPFLHIQEFPRFCARGPCKPPFILDPASATLFRHEYMPTPFCFAGTSGYWS